MKPVGLWSCAAVACVLGAGVAAAQEQPQEPDPGPVPSDLVEQVRVRLLQLNFVALDKRGEPVTDLGPDEVEIRDRGIVQKLAFLEPYDTTSPHRPPPTPPPPPGSRETEPATSSGPRAGPPAAPGRWLILFFDNYLSDQITKMHSVEAARRFLDERVRPSDFVQVVSFDGKLDILQPFTNDRLRLRGAIDAASTRLDHVASDRYGELDDLMDVLERCRQTSSPWGCATQRSGGLEDSRRREADALLTALTNVVRAAKAIPNVKVMVLFSNGFARIPSMEAVEAVRAVLGENVARQMLLREDPQMEEQFDALVAEAAASKLAIFTINPGSAMHTHAISAERRGNHNQETFDATLTDAFRRSDQNFEAGLEDLARRTGGRATRSVDVLGSLNRAFDSTAGLYTAGYYLSSETPSRARDVKIKIRRKGVKAYAPRDLPEPITHRSLTGELTLEAGSCQETGRRTASMKLRLDLDALEFETVGEKVSSNFAVYIRFVDGETGKLLDHDFRQFNVVYPKDHFNVAAHPDPTIEESLIVPCRPLIVEIVAADAQSGARGEFSQRLSL